MHGEDPWLADATWDSGRWTESRAERQGVNNKKPALDEQVA